MGLRRPKISILRILTAGAVGAVLLATIAPNFIRMRAKHRVSSDQICQINLRQLEMALYEYKQENGRYPETLTPIYTSSSRQIDGCLGVMPDPIFGINKKRYGADTYSSGYSRRPMCTWSCPSDGSHQTKDMNIECWSRLGQALETQPTSDPVCPQSGQSLKSTKQDDGFEIWCPAEHTAGRYYGISSVSDTVMYTKSPPPNHAI